MKFFADRSRAFCWTPGMGMSPGEVQYITLRLSSTPIDWFVGPIIDRVEFDHLSWGSVIMSCYKLLRRMKQMNGSSMVLWRWFDYRCCIMNNFVKLLKRFHIRLFADDRIPPFQSVNNAMYVTGFLDHERIFHCKLNNVILRKQSLSCTQQVTLNSWNRNNTSRSPWQSLGAVMNRKFTNKKRTIRRFDVILANRSSVFVPQ